MDKLSEVLRDTFDAHLSEDFVKKASYNKAMDYLEYVSQDAITVADRIDGVLTILKNYDQSEVIGFKVKGFKCVFNEVIKPLYQLKDEDFNPIANALEALFTRVGDNIFCDATSKERRVEAYKSALKLAKDDNVQLPDDWNVAA